jgi:uncharacterized protein (DUF779 family)
VAQRVTATPAALETIARLQAAHGPVQFFQSGGCCEGSAPMCLTAAELAPSPNDVLLGEVGGAPFYIDSEQDRRWREPEFVLDVAAGATGGFSLEGGEGVHFVSCARER